LSCAFIEQHLHDPAHRDGHHVMTFR